MLTVCQTSYVRNGPHFLEAAIRQAFLVIMTLFLASVPSPNGMPPIEALSTITQIAGGVV